MPAVTEQICHALARRDGVSEEVMRELAEVYSAEVSRINQRLTKAVELLRKGLRSEAIQQTHLPPNLFDAAAAMDFAEFEEWCDILQFLGIPVPEELQRSLVEELNEAIVEAQPLTELLKQHRRLAIARAPLAWRLQILRRIAEVDEMTLLWREDLEAWETARIKQLSVEISRAVSNGHLSELEQLRQELTEVKWTVRPEPDLLQRVEAGLQAATESAISQEWERLSPLLHDAFCQFDEPVARKLAQEWKTASRRSRRAPPPELSEPFCSVEDWLREMDGEKKQRQERAAAIGKLESALDRDAPRAELEAAFHACSRFDEQPPQPLVTRYRLAMEQLDLMAARRNQVVLVTVVGLIACAVGIVFFWQRSVAMERSIVDAQREFVSYLESKEITQAEALRTRIESSLPHVSADPRIVSLFGRLESLIDEEARRVEAFADYLRQADVDSPGEKNNAALARAEELAESESEKATAFRIRRRYVKWDHEIESAHTSELLAQVKQIVEKSEELERLGLSDSTSGDVTKLLARLDELIPTFPRAGPSAKEQVSSIRTRLISMRDDSRAATERDRAVRRAMEQLARTAYLDDLAANLQSVIDVSTSAPISLEFSRSLAESSHWSRPRDWNEFADDLASALSNGWSVEIAQRLASQEKNLRSTVSSNPAEEMTGDWKERIANSSRRDELIESLLPELNQMPFKQLHTVIQKTTDLRYFVTMEALQRRPIDVNTTGNIRITHVASATGAESDRGVVGPFTVSEEPRATLLWLHETLSAYRSQFLRDWDHQWMNLFGRLLQREGLDHRVKEALVGQLLHVACEGSQNFERRLRHERQFFREQARTGEPWFVATPFQAEMSKEMVDLFDKLRRLSQGKPKLSDEIAQLKQYQYQWIGVLILDGGGNHQLVAPALASDSGKLVVSKPSTRSNSVTELAIIGEVETGRPRLVRGSRELLAGRPVFLLPH